MVLYRFTIACLPKLPPLGVPYPIYPPNFNSIIHLTSNNETTLLSYYVDQLKRRSLTLRMMGIGYCDTLQIEKIELVATVAIISAGEL